MSTAYGHPHRAAETAEHDHPRARTGGLTRAVKASVQACLGLAPDSQCRARELAHGHRAPGVQSSNFNVEQAALKVLSRTRSQAGWSGSRGLKANVNVDLSGNGERVNPHEAGRYGYSAMSATHPWDSTARRRRHWNRRRRRYHCSGRLNCEACLMRPPCRACS